MNQLTIIGNLTRDPQLRTAGARATVCTFTVAVNRRPSKASGEAQVDYFRVNAQGSLGESWHLCKGRKVAVCGAVRLHHYAAKDGQSKSQLEISAEDVIYLTPKEKPEELIERRSLAQYAAIAQDYEVVLGDDLPF
ncbi:MAG: single-stranded DNA-binding protein [Clostridiales bacterium]|nr:single-stranded DNA-binding protein [Clostridiales bacterium]